MKSNTLNINSNGYIFKTGTIKGRFGNILFSLENLFLLGKNTNSLIKIQGIKNKYDTYTVPGLIFDFRSNKSINNCEEIFLERLLRLRHVYDESLFIDKDKWCLNYIKSFFKKVKKEHYLDDKSLVINIRGGKDIFKKNKVNTKYIQPPISFYEHIIESNNYKDMILVTDSIKYNPVIKLLMIKYQDIELFDGDITSQVDLILNSKNLILARSTFSLFLAKLSKTLKHAYIWYDDDPIWNLFELTKDNCLSKNLKITKYYSNNYINSGDWESTEDQLELMVNHSVKDLNYMEIL